MKRIAFLLVVVIVFGGNSCNWWKQETGERIVLSGNIELKQVNLAFKISGKLIDLPIDEGAHVQTGMVLARMDTIETERQKSRDYANLTAAESRLVQLNTSIQHLKATLAAEIELRQAEVKQAGAKLRELLSGSRVQEIEQATAMVEEARSQRAQAAKDWERAEILFKHDDISAAQHDQSKTRLESTSAVLKQAGERLALIVEGPRKEVIESARAQTERAKASLKLTEARRLEVKRKVQERVTLRAEIDRARAQVGITEALLDDAVIVSPINGIILVKSAEVGEIALAGTTLATIGDIDSPWLRAYIAEKDLGRVELGSKVRVTTDSFPDKAYWGRVSFISSEAEFTPKQVQTAEERVRLVYRIKIDIDNPQHELKLNMPADAEILLDDNS